MFLSCLAVATLYRYNPGHVVCSGTLMSWWGKLIGGTFGFMVGGPIGAVLGAAVGHNFDRGLETLPQQGPGPGGRRQRIQTAFFTATFSVMGHVCKADGRVSSNEIRAARQIMAHMDLNPAQKQAAIAMFNEGKKPGFPLDDVLSQLKREIGHRLSLRRMFMEIQCIAASADQGVHPSAKRVLIHISETLGFNPYELESLLASVSAQLQRRDAPPSLEDAYDILGVGPDTPDDGVKKAYRRLMSQHHPDKLVSRGMPEEMMKVASERTHKIRQAYELVKERRGF